MVDIDRRKFIASAAVSSTALAGCALFGGDDDGGDDDGGGGDGGGDGGGGGDDHGEQVPTVLIDYLSDLPGLTEMSERSIPQLQEALSAIGLEDEIIPRGFVEAGEVLFNDSRETHFQIWNAANNPDRLDPDEFAAIYSPENAGANGRRNFNNYAKPDVACDIYRMVREQRGAANTEERREIINELQSLHSEDIATIPLTVNATYGAYNTNTVEPGPIGAYGIANTGTHTLVQSSSPDGIQANVTPAVVETTVHMRFTGPTGLVPWSSIVYSPLFYYDEDYNFIDVLATGFEYSDDGTSLEVGLEDATFHNGDPITSEDVKWTFEHLVANRDAYPQVPDVPLESVETPDEQTVVFQLSERFTPFLTRFLPLWGILPKDHFIEQGAEDDPNGFELDSIIGSGPYEVSSLNRGESLLLSPHDSHPLYSPDSNLALIGFADAEGAFRAFRNGEINWLQSIDAGLAEEARETVDFASVEITEAASNFLLWPQCNWGPSKHRPIRMAFSQAINRERISEIIAFGDASPVLHSTIKAPTHPWFDEDALTQVADSPTANVDTATQVLEDAGYTFDDDGNLRYPPDADLSPDWEEGEEPADYPDEFPCLG